MPAFNRKLKLAVNSFPVDKMKSSAEPHGLEVSMHYVRRVCQSIILIGGDMRRMVGRIKLRVRKNLTRITCCFAMLALLAATSSATADGYPGANSSSPPQKSNRTKFMKKNLPNFSEVTT